MRAGSALALLAALVAPATAAAHGAPVRIEPAEATVEPGESASATVRVESDKSCVSGTTSVGSVSFSPTCGSTTYSMVVATSPETPDGTYEVAVTVTQERRTDRTEVHTRWFLLTVRAAHTTTTTEPPQTTTTSRPPQPTSTTAPSGTATTSTTTNPSTGSPGPSPGSTTAPPASSGGGGGPDPTASPDSPAAGTSGGAPSPGGSSAGPSPTAGQGAGASGEAGDGARAGGTAQVQGATFSRLPGGGTGTRLTGVRAVPGRDRSDAASRSEAPSTASDDLEAALSLPAATGFATLASLAESGAPADSIFLPFASPAYRSCLPLTAPCGDAGGGLVLIPAGAEAGADVAWAPVDQAAGAPVRSAPTRSTPVLPAVGQAPADPAGTTYLLPVLRASYRGSRLVVVPRRLNERLALVAGPATKTEVLPTAVGHTPAAPSNALGVVFQGASVVPSEELESKTPVIVAVPSGQVPVVYGVLPDPEWGLNRDFLPLFGTGSLPFLATRADGTPGLLIPRPSGLTVPGAEEAAVGASDLPEEAGGNGNLAVVATLFAMVLAVLGATVASRRLPRWWRSRRRDVEVPDLGEWWRRIR